MSGRTKGELLDLLSAARNQLVQVQHEVRALKRELYEIRYQEYVARLERFNAEHPGPQDFELWWQQVRPLCEDCQREIVRPDDHSLTMSHGQAPILCCGRHDPW